MTLSPHVRKALDLWVDASPVHEFVFKDSTWFGRCTVALSLGDEEPLVTGDAPSWDDATENALRQAIDLEGIAESRRRYAAVLDALSAR